MSNAFTLDDIRAATEAKYGSTDIDLGGGDVVRLLNPLRLPKVRRDRMTELQESFTPKDDAPDVTEEQQAETLREILRTVAEGEGPVTRLIDLAGEDLALLMTVFDKYVSGAQVGEASASPA